MFWFFSVFENPFTDIILFCDKTHFIPLLIFLCQKIYICDRPEQSLALWCCRCWSWSVLHMHTLTLQRSLLRSLRHVRCAKCLHKISGTTVRNICSVINPTRSLLTGSLISHKTTITTKPYVKVFLFMTPATFSLLCHTNNCRQHCLLKYFTIAYLKCQGCHSCKNT